MKSNKERKNKYEENKDLYICPKSSIGCDSGGCSHKKPHEIIKMISGENCDIYAGQCFKCIPIIKEWDK